MCRKRLDMRERMPSGMEEYLETYGWHFSKKLCEWAVSKMKKDGASMQMMDKASVEANLKRFGVDPSKYNGYDGVYVYHMAKADFLGTALTDESRLALYVKAYLDDEDGYDEIAMTRFYADCIGKGEMPEWEDCL